MLNRFLPLYFTVFISALSLTAIIEHHLIPMLRGKADQPIYDKGPNWHKAKGAIPTMGGLAFLIASTVSFFICSIFFFITANNTSALRILTFAFLCIGNALIGLVDDLTKLKRKENTGLTPKQKLLLQGIIAFAFLFMNSKLSASGYMFDLILFKISSPFLYYPAGLFLILGIINCANLTDGIDGLASSVAYAIGIIFFIKSAATNEICALISVILIGSSLAFLAFNINPAKIFMGDTGSLLLGAMAVSCAFAGETPISIISIGAIYVIEGVSVILQVIYYKLTKKRLFKMAPLHHHLEKSGFSENKICLIAMIITFITSLFAFIIKQ